MPDRARAQVRSPYRAESLGGLRPPARLSPFWLNSGLRPETPGIKDKGMGFKKASDPRHKVVKVFLTSDQKALVEAEAAAAMLTVSAYAVRRLFGKQAKDRYSYHAINELSALTRQLKRHHLDTAGRDEARLQTLLDQIGVAIERLWTGRGPE